MSKKELVAEAKKLGLDVDSKMTVAEIEAALQQHAAETAQSHEDEVVSGPTAVVAENQGGEIVLVFGTRGVTPEQSWTEDFSVAISRDDALGLVADLPNVVQNAHATAGHVG